MRFIINTHDLKVSKSLIEMILEYELDTPISVKEVEELNEEELDDMAWCKAREEYLDGYREPYAEGLKTGYHIVLEDK